MVLLGLVVLRLLLRLRRREREWGDDFAVVFLLGSFVWKGEEENSIALAFLGLNS